MTGFVTNLSALREARAKELRELQQGPSWLERQAPWLSASAHAVALGALALFVDGSPNFAVLVPIASLALGYFGGDAFREARAMRRAARIRELEHELDRLATLLLFRRELSGRAQKDLGLS